MKNQYIELLQDVRHNAYKLGYIEGIEYEKAENAKHVESIKKELLTTQQRVQWWQDKYARMQENYENQIRNLQGKISNTLQLDQTFNNSTDALNASLELETDPDVYTSWVDEDNKNYYTD